MVVCPQKLAQPIGLTRLPAAEPTSGAGTGWSCITPDAAAAGATTAGGALGALLYLALDLVHGGRADPACASERVAAGPGQRAALNSAVATWGRGHQRLSRRVRRAPGAAGVWRRDREALVVDGGDPAWRLLAVVLSDIIAGAAVILVGATAAAET